MKPPYPQVKLRTLNQKVQSSGLTLAEIGRRVGVHESTVHGWLNDYRRPSLQNLEKLAEVLSVPVEHLTHGGKHG